MSCLCSGTGSYRVSRFSVLLNEYRIVDKECACGVKSIDSLYEDVMRGAKIGGATPAFAEPVSPLTTSR